MSFAKLPREIIGCIAEYLSDADFLSLTSCSRQLHISATDNYLWRHRAEQYQQWDPRRGSMPRWPKNWLDVYQSRRKLEKHTKAILDTVIYDVPWRHKHIFKLIKLGPEAGEYLEHLVMEPDDSHGSAVNDILARRLFAGCALTALGRQNAIKYWKSIAPIMANETEPLPVDVLEKALDFSQCFYPYSHVKTAHPTSYRKQLYDASRLLLGEYPNIKAFPVAEKVVCILSAISGYSRAYPAFARTLSRYTTRREKYILFISLAHSLGLDVQSFHDWATIPGTLLFLPGENGRYISVDLTSIELEKATSPSNFFPDLTIVRSLPDSSATQFKRTSGRLWLITFLSSLTPTNSQTVDSAILDDYLKYAQIWALFIFYGYDATNPANLNDHRREAMTVIDYHKLARWINFHSTFCELDFNRKVWFDFIHDHLAAGIDAFLYNLGTLTVFDTALYEIEGRSWLSKEIPRPRSNLLNRNIWMGSAGLNVCGNGYDQSRIRYKIGDVIYRERYRQYYAIVGIQPDSGVNTEDQGPFYITLSQGYDFHLLKSTSISPCPQYQRIDPKDFPLAGIFFKRWDNNQRRFIPLNEPEDDDDGKGKMAKRRLSSQYGRRVAHVEEVTFTPFETDDVTSKMRRMRL